MLVPEIDSDGGHVGGAEFIICELGENGWLSDTRTACEDDLYELVRPFDHGESELFDKWYLLPKSDEKY